ncbi:MFS general substrate transporter [Mytilinidion resinicola]|uniref:MFS general substrate transporter n=1 Tax=Mytilinidion resinicola TaxID=574789 RepID=A0A6A6YV21_9PEZI|nr:MFS general substrate transporter [Mytilinidion resinicola]KAF2811807.1 MFS general substrate transporter [Mytilinidion resinicola]
MDHPPPPVLNLQRPAERDSQPQRPKFSPDWSTAHSEQKWEILWHQKRFTIWALYSAIGGVMFGFDFGLAGTLTALPAFQRVYGKPYTSQTSGYLVPANYQSGWAGISMGGLIVGVLLGGQLLERLGRRHSLAMGAGLTGVGVGMQLGSVEWKLFLCGRGVAVILVGGYPFYPESPYYLISKDETEKARKALTQIYGSSDSSLIDADLSRISANVTFSKEVQAAAAQKGPLLLQCFRGTNLKRTTIAILPVAAQQLIGAPFVLGYVTYFLELIGVTEYFTVSTVLYAVMLLANISAFFFIETTGRRPLIVYGTAVLTLLLLVMGIVGCVSTSAAKWAVVVLIFLWSIVFQLTLGAIGFAIGSEISSLPLRASTQSIIGVTQGFMGWLVGFISPYLINPDAGNLGAKVGFVFAGFGVPLCVAFWFLIPETKGLGFDDMDYLFARKVPCRRFGDEIRKRRAEESGRVLDEEKADT